MALALALGAHAAWAPTEPILFVGGNLTLGPGGKRTNLAQLSLANPSAVLRGETRWTDDYEPTLYLYGAANGIVLDIVVNRSSALSKGAADEAFAVGLFDTTSASSSQAQYCSVGRWTGEKELHRVGEGLCSRASDPEPTRVLAAEIGDGGDVFVGGRFQARAERHARRARRAARAESGAARAEQRALSFGALPSPRRGGS